MSSTTSSILNTLGLGAPDPASYTNASTMATQQTQAVSSLQATVSSANVALNFATTAGVSSSVLTKLQSVVSQGKTLLSQAATMPAAKLEAARAKLESNAIASQFAAVQDQYDTTLKNLKKEIPIIQARVTEIHQDKSTSAGLVSEYDSLLKDISGSIALLVASPPVFIPPSKSLTSGSSGSEVAYVIPSTPTADDYQERLDVLDGKKEQEEGNGYTMSRMWRMFKYWVSTYLYPAFVYLLTFSAAILGGIIISNAYVETEKGFVGNRLFYFIYGALGFPISIIYACFKTPFWVAGLFPATPRVKPATQTGGAGLTVTGMQDILLGIQVPTPGQTASAAAAAAATASAAAAATAAAAASHEIFIESEVKQADGTLKSHILPPASAFDIFTFVLVDKTKTPKYQKDGQTRLWYISLIYAALISSYAVTNDLIPTLTLPVV